MEANKTNLTKYSITLLAIKLLRQGETEDLVRCAVEMCILPETMIPQETERIILTARRCANRLPA